MAVPSCICLLSGAQGLLLNSVLSAQEEMESLLLAVRNVALGKAPTGTTAEVQQVEAMLASLGAAAEPETASPRQRITGFVHKAGNLAASELLTTELEANHNRAQFAKV